MTDEIRLPPLPDEDGYITTKIIGRDVALNAYRPSTMESYARDAVKADRQQRGEPAGEVAGTYKGAYSVGNVFFPKDGPLLSGTKLYTAPQPAEPRRGEPIMYLRTLNGKPDWSEDCIADCESDLIHDEEMYAEGYGVMPLYAAPQLVASPQEPPCNT